MLDRSTLDILRSSRNLLAFSAGGDSSALFHLLIDKEIEFDCVHVNYHTRKNSNIEAEYVQELSKKHSKKAYIYDAKRVDKNFEAKAREIRYNFFSNCIRENGYDTLLTAHHLGDRLEWFLMQLSKGAGLYELMGMKAVDVRDDYTIVRPLLHVNKKELSEYLKSRDIEWFEDESNSDESYRRNYFRHNFSEPLLEKFSKQIEKSFKYLDEDSYIEDIQLLHVKKLSYFKTLQNRRHTLLHVDKILKQRGFIMRQGDKEILKKRDSHIVGRKYVVSIGKHFTFIAPYRVDNMGREFKERCRRLKIPKLLRPYLFSEEEAFDAVASVFL